MLRSSCQLDAHLQAWHARCSKAQEKLGLIVSVATQTAARLRGVLPVVVDADYWEDIGEALDDIFIPDAEIW